MLIWFILNYFSFFDTVTLFLFIIYILKNTNSNSVIHLISRCKYQCQYPLEYVWRFGDQQNYCEVNKTNSWECDTRLADKYKMSPTLVYFLVSSDASYSTALWWDLRSGRRRSRAGSAGAGRLGGKKASQTIRQ